ncbi:MAG: eIF2 kinase Gcn2p negative regulator [Chrysothrix sp. TS-e1954]|nr:MAG: eIF2 kinase Gcn2p negative regulator [Chrysothrix sp. TS-e1954]
MNDALADEMLSINAIYEPHTLQSYGHSNNVLALKLDALPIALLLSFPKQYPNQPPELSGTVTMGTESSRQEASMIMEHARQVLRDVYVPGQPCIFDVAEGLREKPGLPDVNRVGSRHVKEANFDESSVLEESKDPSNTTVNVDPDWAISEVLTEKKSVFVARAAEVATTWQAQQNIQHLLGTNKKVAQATHNITAWRICGTSSNPSAATYQDCDDDGETAAGGRVLHLLQLMGAWNLVVVVTRWHGGTNLGPDRFRIINAVTRDAVINARRSNAKHTQSSAEALN